MIGALIRGTLFRAGLIAGGFTVAALAVERCPVPGLVRAAAMLALPCVLLRVLRREERRLTGSAGRIGARPPRPPAPAAPGRRPR